MKQLDLAPGVVHDTAVDYVYPVGISLLFLAIGALIISLMLWKEHKVNVKRFEDVIEALEAGRHEVGERLDRVHYRQEIQEE